MSTQSEPGIEGVSRICTIRSSIPDTSRSTVEGDAPEKELFSTVVLYEHP
jgi:hypothetical protein